MRKLVVAVLSAMLGVTGVALGEGPPGGKDRQIRPGTAKPAQPKPSLKRFLRTRVPEVDWEDTPFGEVLEWFREQGQINVTVRWHVLQEKDIDPDTPVSVRLKNATMGTILSEVLAQLSATEELAYVGVGLTLTISTRVDLNKKLYTRTYAVNDLLFRIPDFTEAPSINLQQASGGSGPGGGSAQQNPFQGGGGGGGGDDDTRSRTERVKELIDVIKQTVEPESWRDGGGEGTISSFNDNVLVVRACLEVHEKLGGPLLLEE